MSDNRIRLKIIEGKRYYAIYMEDEKHADELLKERKIIGYSKQGNLIIAYFPA